MVDESWQPIETAPIGKTVQVKLDCGCEDLAIAVERTKRMTYWRNPSGWRVWPTHWKSVAEEKVGA